MIMNEFYWDAFEINRNRKMQINSCYSDICRALFSYLANSIQIIKSFNKSAKASQIILDLL